MGNVKKVVLAYSGGLDTSIIIPWLKEHYGGAEVIAFCGDVGQGDDYAAVTKKALATGASKCIVKDLREEFVRDYCFKALSAGAVYEDRYLLGTALARPLLAYHQVQVRHQGEGRRPRPRRHRQGQRPGPLRGDLRRLRPPPEGDRAVAGVDDPLPRGRARLRAQARHPGRPDEEGPLQPRRQPLAPLPRGRQPRGRLGRPAEGDVQADRGPARRAGEAAAHHARLRAGRAGDARRQAPQARPDDRDAQPGGGRARRGPPRPRREPPRRHQVARRLRDARRHRPPHRPPRARAARARPRHAALQAGGVRALRAARLRRPVVLDPARGARRLRGRDGEGGHRRGADPPLQGLRGGGRPPLRRAASTGRTSPRSARAWPTTTRTRRASSASSASRSGSGRSPATA